MMCLGRCILEEHTPYGIGNYRAIISEGNKEIYEKIKNFLEDIKYVGFSNFDFNGTIGPFVAIIGFHNHQLVYRLNQILLYHTLFLLLYLIIYTSC